MFASSSEHQQRIPALRDLLDKQLTAGAEAPLSSQLSDTEIQSLVLDRLADLGRQFPIRVHVQTENGDVFLRGNVGSTLEKIAILRQVDELSAVTRVYDLMVVKGRFQGNEIAEKQRTTPWTGTKSFWTSAVVGLLALSAAWQSSRLSLSSTAVHRLNGSSVSGLSGQGREKTSPRLHLVVPEFVDNAAQLQFHK